MRNGLLPAERLYPLVRNLPSSLDRKIISTNKQRNKQTNNKLVDKPQLVQVVSEVCDLPPLAPR